MDKQTSAKTAFLAEILRSGEEYAGIASAMRAHPVLVRWLKKDKQP